MGPCSGVLQLNLTKPCLLQIRITCFLNIVELLVEVMCVQFTSVFRVLKFQFITCCSDNVKLILAPVKAVELSLLYPSTHCMVR